MKIYTKTGDQGQTGLLGGERVGKDEPRVSTYGTVDEANSMLGLARSLCCDQEVKDTIFLLQKKMFILGAHLATPKEQLAKLKEKITERDIQYLEELIDYFEHKRTPTHGFVVPGNSSASAALDVARTIVRRGERLAVALSRQEEVAGAILIYFNRLSDLIFVLARVEETTALVEIVTQKVRKQLEPQKLNLALAKKIIQKAQEKAAEIKVPMVVAIVDQGGALVACERQDNALLASIDLAINKAYSAAVLKQPTHILGELSQPGQSLYGLQQQGKIVIFGGGFPLIAGAELRGAIGVSGGSVEEDMAVAQGGLEFWEKEC